ncbi:MAG TPA: hypothetical protein VJC03_06935, partial [bacterium]|nr:hypothetical protein [bacterium]
LDKTATEKIARLQIIIGRLYDLLLEGLRKGKKLILTEPRMILSTEMTGSLPDSLLIEMLIEMQVNIGISYLALLIAYNNRVLAEKEGAKSYHVALSRDSSSVFFFTEDQIESAGLAGFLYYLGYCHETLRKARELMTSGAQLTPEERKDAEEDMVQKTIRMFKSHVRLGTENLPRNIIKMVAGNPPEGAVGASLLVYSDLLKIVRDFFGLVFPSPFRPTPFSVGAAVRYLTRSGNYDHDKNGLDIFLRYVIQPFIPGEILKVHMQGTGRQTPIALVATSRYDKMEDRKADVSVLPNIQILQIFPPETTSFQEGQEIDIYEKNSFIRGFAEGYRLFGFVPCQESEIPY